MLEALRLARGSCYLLDVEAKQAGAWGPECKIAKFIQLPEGELSTPTKWPDAGEGDYMYSPPRIGTDSVRFILENGAGKQVDVTVKIKILKWEPEGAADTETQLATLEQSNELSPWSAATAFDSDVAGLSGVTYSFSNRGAAALAQTTGTTITLDTDAAGHGWFIDYTPYLNEEFLPTSNPNEWVAKPGSEAEGKMDLLSVLWHEYGHALRGWQQVARMKLRGMRGVRASDHPGFCCTPSRLAAAALGAAGMRRL